MTYPRDLLNQIIDLTPCDSIPGTQLIFVHLKAALVPLLAERKRDARLTELRAAEAPADKIDQVQGLIRKSGILPK